MVLAFFGLLDFLRVTGLFFLCFGFPGVTATLRLIAVPSATLAPARGDIWRLNLYRFERVRDGGRVVADEASAWGTVGAVDFHVPEAFGRLIFGGPATAVEAGSWGRVKGRAAE